MADIFEAALAEMNANGTLVFGPVGFQEYLETHGLAASKTADWISINHWGQLKSSLKSLNVMVFRLGMSTTTKTKFALVRVDDVRDFFLFETVEPHPTTFLSSARMRDLFGYTMFDASETTLVNLAFASGLITQALGLDDAGPLAAPARGVLRATFELQPHTAVPQRFEHVNGQIEIDAIFVGRRNGRDHLFILEAKQSKDALAKHKLVYPILAVAPRVPADIPIVPVYMRAERGPAGYRYRVAECKFPNPRVTSAGLDELHTVQSCDLTLPLAGSLP
jgi:hypothetical protein